MTIPNLFRAALLPLVLCALLPGAASAQVDKQDNEVAANASLYTQLKGGTPNLTVGVHYGRLLHDLTIFGKKIEGLQVGGDALFSGPLDLTGGFLSLFPMARLYLTAKDPRLTPYVGVGAGLSVFKYLDVSFNLAYDINGGVKLFINPTTAAFVQLDLTGPFTDPGSSSLILSLGLSVFF